MSLTQPRCLARATLYRLESLIITNSIGQGPSRKAKSLSDSQEIFSVLWKPKVHYRVHRCPALVHILSQVDTVHAHSTELFKIPFNIVLPSRPSKSPLSFRFPHQNPVCNCSLAHMCYIPRQTHSS
jgi:hypothetical protein